MFFSLKFKSGDFLLGARFFFKILFSHILICRTQHPGEIMLGRGAGCWVWCFPCKASLWKHAAGELPFPRLPLPLRLHSSIAERASKTSRDQLVLVWELRGPTSPTDITQSSSSPRHTHTHTLPVHACMPLTYTQPQRGNRCYYFRSSPTLIKMWQLAYCSLLPSFLCCQPLISPAWSNPGFT